MLAERFRSSADRCLPAGSIYNPPPGILLTTFKLAQVVVEEHVSSDVQRALRNAPTRKRLFTVIEEVAGAVGAAENKEKRRHITAMDRCVSGAGSALWHLLRSGMKTDRIHTLFQRQAREAMQLAQTYLGMTQAQLSEALQKAHTGHSSEVQQCFHCKATCGSLLCFSSKAPDASGSASVCCADCATLTGMCTEWQVCVGSAQGVV